MPLDFIDKYLILKFNYPWGNDLSEVWILNIGFYAIFSEDFNRDETTITVGTSIWNLIMQGDR